MATSQRWILKSTLNTCGEHGIPNNLLNPCSSRFKIVLITLRQGLPYRTPTENQHWICKKHLQLGTSRAPVAGEKPLADKTWAQFKSHFSATRYQHTQMQGESQATTGYHSANAAVGHT
jgi:hypothetical protein